jgi:ElaB/YqjD/DUF883 family membrane-anchored ribosome-binding protein
MTGTREIEAIREDIAQLREDLKKLVGKMGAIGGQVTDNLIEQAEETLDELKARAGKSYNRIATEGRRYAKSAEKTIEKSVAEHPFGTAMIALAVGVILAQLLGRSQSR